MHVFITKRLDRPDTRTWPGHLNRLSPNSSTGRQLTKQPPLVRSPCRGPCEAVLAAPLHARRANAAKRARETCAWSPPQADGIANQARKAVEGQSHTKETKTLLRECGDSTARRGTVMLPPTVPRKNSDGCRGAGCLTAAVTAGSSKMPLSPTALFPIASLPPEARGTPVSPCTTEPQKHAPSGTQQLPKRRAVEYVARDCRVLHLCLHPNVAALSSSSDSN